jgi:hypothetical protein
MHPKKHQHKKHHHKVRDKETIKDNAVVGRLGGGYPVLGRDWHDDMYGIVTGGGLGYYTGTDIDAPTAQGEEWESNAGAESSEPSAPTGGVAGAAATV